MITKLTNKQEALLETYKDKWLKIGLSTEDFTFEMAQQIADFYYEKIAGKKKVPVVIMDSPYSAWLAVCILANSQVESQVWSQVRSQVRSQVELQVESQVWSQVELQVESQVWSQVESQVESQVWSQVRSQVRSQVELQVESQVELQVESQPNLMRFMSPYLYGNLDSPYFAFYDYMAEVLGLDFGEKWDWYKSTSQISLFYPLENVCIIARKPIEIHMNEKGQLHADGKSAILYKDGFAVWSLNGVRVTKELAETPAGLLSLDMFKQEQNADVRTEFIRKYGIDRMIDMGKIVDSYEHYDNQLWDESEYKLIDMANIFDTIRYAPHLYMKNQTTGVYHLEGVSPDCKNLVEAFKFREYENFNNFNTIFVK